LLLNENDTKNRVSECLKTAFFINSNEDAFDAILKFKKNKDAYAIVVNNDNDVVGIVSAKQVYTYALRN
jgi:Mg2+/Co2+ transporter CorB